MQEPQQIKDKAQEFNDKMVEMKEKLNLPEKQKIVGIDLVDDISLGGDLNRKSVFVIKIQDEDGGVYHIVTDKEVNQIATIAKDGRIELSEREKQLWEKFIGKEKEQTLDQKKRYDFEKEYYLEEYKTIKQEKGKKSKKQADEEKEEQNDNDTLDIDDDNIVAKLKIEDRETFGQAINRKLYADAYIVKYVDNKTKVMQETSDGSLIEIAGLETSEFNMEVMEQLNIDKPDENQTIKAGDLTTIRTEDPKYSYVVVREEDSNKGIVIVNSTNETRVYTFDDEGKDEIKEIETSIQYRINNGNDDEENEGSRNRAVENNEKEQEDEDEGRTPWGDAYARERR